MIDFEQIEKVLDEAFAKETKESLLSFMKQNKVKREQADWEECMYEAISECMDYDYSSNLHSEVPDNSFNYALAI